MANSYRELKASLANKITQWIVENSQGLITATKMNTIMSDMLGVTDFIFSNDAVKTADYKIDSNQVTANMIAGATIDSIALVANMTILLSGQSNGSQNGLWLIQQGTAPVRPENFETVAEQTASVIRVLNVRSRQLDTLYRVDFSGSNIVISNMLEDMMLLYQNSSFGGGVLPASAAPAVGTDPMYWIAQGVGTYTNFGGQVITQAIAFIIWTGTGWSKYEANLDLSAYAKKVLDANLVGNGYKGTGFAAGSVSGDLSTYELTEAQAIQLLRLHNPSLSFKGFVNTTTTPIPAATLNHAYVATENGTVLGVAGVVKGQAIVGSGSGFSAESQGIVNENSANFSRDYLSAVRKIYSYLKGTPITSAYTSYVATGVPISSIMGWRQNCNYTAPFRAAEIAITSNVTGVRVNAHIWNDEKELVATGTSYYTETTGNTQLLLFVFDNEINAVLLGGGNYYIGFQPADNVTQLNYPPSTGTATGIINDTPKTQYHNTSDYNVWSDSSGTNMWWFRLYTVDNMVNPTNNDILSNAIDALELLWATYYTSILTYDSLAITLPTVAATYGTRASTYTGWGAKFTPAGVSFNAVKIKNLGRGAVAEDAKWAFIRVWVKQSIGINDVTSIAYTPFIPIDSESNQIAEIVLPLMDEGLNNFVTLDDSDFTGSTYFIGFMLYNKDMDRAFGGETKGTQSNYIKIGIGGLGESYYNINTGNNLTGTGWRGSFGDNCIPFEHLLLTNPELILSLNQTDKLQTQVDAMQEQIDLLSPLAVEVILPDTINAIVGDTLQLFYRGMIKAPNPYVYDILPTCSKGKDFRRYFEYLPVTADIGTTTFKLEVKDREGNILGTKTCNLVTKAAVQSPATVKKILCVGDSLTSAGYWPQEASRRLIGTGGTPAGLVLTNLSFLGRVTSHEIGWEGNGGWSWGSYATAGRTAYRFTVSGVTTAPALNSVYTNNGQSFTIVEINITSGSGNILGLATGAPTASGTLTKSSGTGDATVSFSASALDAGNPFWDSSIGALDFADYVDAYMGGTCDVVYFLLSWNGQTSWKTDFSAEVALAKTLIDHIHTQYPSCKIKVMGIQLPSLNGGMGANYGADAPGYADTYGNVVTVLNQNKAYQAFANEARYSSFVEYVSVSDQFDSENNMQEAAKIVNTRATKTEFIGTNGVHPAPAGYMQIGDVLFRNIVANYCQ